MSFQQLPRSADEPASRLGRRGFLAGAAGVAAATTVLGSLDAVPAAATAESKAGKDKPLSGRPVRTKSGAGQRRSGGSRRCHRLQQSVTGVGGRPVGLAQHGGVGPRTDRRASQVVRGVLDQPRAGPVRAAASRRSIRSNDAKSLPTSSRPPFRNASESMTAEPDELISSVSLVKRRGRAVTPRAMTNPNTVAARVTASPCRARGPRRGARRMRRKTAGCPTAPSSSGRHGPRGALLTGGVAAAAVGVAMLALPWPLQHRQALADAPPRTAHMLLNDGNGTAVRVRSHGASGRSRTDAELRGGCISWCCWTGGCSRSRGWVRPRTYRCR